MRIALGVMGIAALALSAPAGAAEINTGRQLVEACKNYAAKDENAMRAPDRCRLFLVSFFTAYVESEHARQEALVKGLPAKATTTCVRLPDFLSYREMAQRVVAYGDGHQNELDQSAGNLAQHTLEADFPCPAPH